MSHLLKNRKRQQSPCKGTLDKHPTRKKGLYQTTLMEFPSISSQEPAFSSTHGKDLWNDELKLGIDYKKKVAEEMMRPSIIESESVNGNKVELRQCFCPRPSKQCKKMELQLWQRRMLGILIFSVIW